MGPVKEVLVRESVVREDDAERSTGRDHPVVELRGLFSRERMVKEVRPWKKSEGILVNC